MHHLWKSNESVPKNIMDPSIWIPFFGIAGGTVMLTVLMSPIWLWMRYRHQREREKMKLGTANPETEAKLSRMVERMENLENLMCRLDSEINTQLERSMSMGRIITTPSAAGVSQMPTTFMNVASALESRYQLLKELGRGGMGIVFQAYDKQLKEQVAIKILSPLLSNDPDALERLKREVSSARRITHPNVIRIHDLSEIGGLNFVSMEYFPGTNLREHIKSSGGLSLNEALSIALQVCDGLQAAHDQGVIHRDLKSQNIIISTSNQIKIIDFGLASSRQMQNLTATGLILGTPEYMAPEQVAGKRLDERADIYSFGIILYELFTGRVPFTGNSAISIGFQQMKDEPGPPSQINPQISTALEAVILKALQKEPVHRHPNVQELRTELEQAIRVPSGVGKIQERVASPERLRE